MSFFDPERPSRPLLESIKEAMERLPTKDAAAPVEFHHPLCRRFLAALDGREDSCTCGDTARAPKSE